MVTEKKKIQAPLPIYPKERIELRKLAAAEDKTVAQFLRDKINAQFANEGITFRLATPEKGAQG